MRNYITNEFNTSQAQIDGRDTSRTSMSDAIPLILMALIPGIFCMWKIWQFFQH